MGVGVFVSSTDTEVGKTVVSGLLCRCLSQLGYSVAYYKPVQSGAIAETTPEGITTWSSPDVAMVQRLAPTVTTCCSYALPLPAAPQLAAEHYTPPIQIEFSELDAQLAQLLQRHDIVAIEGAGGLAVPLAPQLSIVDLVRRWQLPLILVSRPHLGTINQTSLSVFYAQKHGLRVLAIAMNYTEPQLDPHDPILATAPRFIAQMSGNLPIYQLPYLDLDAPDGVVVGDQLKALAITVLTALQCSA
jgi:dethiobiotin synthetase